MVMVLPNSILLTQSRVYGNKDWEFTQDIKQGDNFYYYVFDVCHLFRFPVKQGKRCTVCCRKKTDEDSVVLEAITIL